MFGKKKVTKSINNTSVRYKLNVFNRSDVVTKKCMTHRVTELKSSKIGSFQVIE